MPFFNEKDAASREVCDENLQMAMDDKLKPLKTAEPIVEEYDERKQCA